MNIGPVNQVAPPSPKEVSSDPSLQLVQATLAEVQAMQQQTSQISGKGLKVNTVA